VQLLVISQVKLPKGALPTGDTGPLRVKCETPVPVSEPGTTVPPVARLKVKSSCMSWFSIGTRIVFMLIVASHQLTI
jgi:hypothetical protein